MKLRLRSLLTQFTLRDLFWLMVVCAAMSYAYRQHNLVANAQAASQRAVVEADDTKLKYRRALDNFLEALRKQDEQFAKEVAEAKQQPPPMFDPDIHAYPWEDKDMAASRQAKAKAEAEAETASLPTATSPPTPK